MTQDELFAGTVTGEMLRDEGIQMALDHAGDDWTWSATQIALARFKMAGDAGCLFEEARLYADSVGFPPPPSPNSWGAIAMSLSRKEKIIKTGEYRKAKSLRSHAHAFPVWRINGNQSSH
jgi:hypothetical protein